MMKRQQKGFTLIELMIVVAIIGILASVAIPMYGDYVTRSRLSTVLASVSNVKTALALSKQEGNSVSNDLKVGSSSSGTWSEIGLSSAPSVPDGVSLMSIDKTTFAIALTLEESIAGGDSQSGKVITLTPTFGANASWKATYTGEKDKGNTNMVKEYLKKYAGGS